MSHLLLSRYFAGRTHYFRNKNELLCDKREGVKEVDFLKKELGLHAFSAQYQQNPISMQSQFIDKKWIQKYFKKFSAKYYPVFRKKFL